MTFHEILSRMDHEDACHQAWGLVQTAARDRAIAAKVRAYMRSVRKGPASKTTTRDRQAIALIVARVEECVA